MIRNVRDPGGVIGTFSTAASILLALSGLLSLAIAGNNSQGFGTGELTIWAIVGVANWAGCVGVAMGRARPQLGESLVVLAALAFAAFYFWALLPLVIGPAIAALVVLRTRRLSSQAALATA